jgi:adenylate cyclase
VELLTLQALATAAGASVERVVQLREMGLVRGAAGAYVPSDVARVLHFPEATSAVTFALGAVDAAGRNGLGALHAGADAGPMIRRDGDYFGTVVNVASRVAAEAAAGEVLVTPEVVAAWEGNGGIRFDSLGAVALKNVAGPVDLFRARREEVEEHG